jgi:hypothetical protein
MKEEEGECEDDASSASSSVSSSLETKSSTVEATVSRCKTLLLKQSRKKLTIVSLVYGSYYG